MKNLLLKFLLSKLGIVLTPVFASALAAIATALAKYGVTLDAEQQLQVVGWLTVAITTAAQGWALKSTGDATEEIQQATGAIKDRVAGFDTVKAVKIAVISPARPLPKITGPGK